MLIWLAWLIFVVWIGRFITDRWRLYRAKDPYIQDPPELSTFLYIEAVLVSNGSLHMWLDEKPLYPRPTRGFLGSGYSEAQLFFITAWAVLLLMGFRWYWLGTKNDPVTRWNLGCFLLIIGLVFTSLFCWLILDIPISHNTPFL